MEMVGDKLRCYVCPILASHGVVVEAVTWERVQQTAMIDPARRVFLIQGRKWGVSEGVFQVPGRS